MDLIPGLTHELRIELFDEGPDGEAVWVGLVGDEEWYVEGFVNDSVWTVLDRLVRAYDEEENV